MNETVVAELASKVMQGDMKAFEKLYTEFSPLVYSILLEITHDTYEAEDLTQECFVSALKNINTLKDPSKVKKWLTAIAANKGKDYLRKKKPALLGEEHEYIFDIQEEKNASLLPDESAILDERSEEIREIVNSVSEDKRLCLVLFYQHEMSIAEISEELGISESAVKSRLFRAREDIREEVEKRNKKGMPLFGVAPLPLMLFALRKSSQAAAVSFAGSAAQTAAFAGVTAVASTASAASTAAAATTAASATASAAGTTATAATGIGAKVAAMSVAQKVVAGVTAATIATGSATVTTVVVKNKIEEKSTVTTTYTEEVTTAPDYGFESETVFVPAVAESETSTSAVPESNKPTSAKQSTNVIQSTSEKSTSSNITTTKSTAKTTTQKQTTTTTKPKTTTTTKATTTQKETTTKKETTTEEVTTAKATTTTTKAVTTTKTETTTTTKAATTTTTESASPATVTVTVWGEGTSTTKTLYFEAGEKITATEIENRLSDEYGIEAIADDINITAEAGGNYTATAYE